MGHLPSSSSRQGTLKPAFDDKDNPLIIQAASSLHVILPLSSSLVLAGRLVCNILRAGSLKCVLASNLRREHQGARDADQERCVQALENAKANDLLFWASRYNLFVLWSADRTHPWDSLPGAASYVTLEIGKQRGSDSEVPSSALRVIDPAASGGCDGLDVTDEFFIVTKVHTGKDFQSDAA